MDKPLLSICIPTYNRSKYLKNSIESIICQQEFLDGKVEIVISDNASEDDTPSVVKAYTDRYCNIHYHRNSENVRDQNFPIAVSHAHGVLRRLCNDTLVFSPSALASMCRIIEENREKKPFLCWSNGFARCEGELLSADFPEYIRYVSFYMTSLAFFSLWEEECADIQNDTDGCELSLWQVRKGLEIAYRKNDILICNTCFTETQVVEKKNISYGLYKVFFENFFLLLAPYFDNHALTEGDREYLEKDLLFRFFLGWCIRWELQDKSLLYSQTENLKQSIWNQYRDKPYWAEFRRLYYFRLFKARVKQVLKPLLKG